MCKWCLLVASITLNLPLCLELYFNYVQTFLYPLRWLLNELFFAGPYVILLIISHETSSIY